MSGYQEEVLTNLLDLQAELRGGEAEPHDETESTSPEAPADEAPADEAPADTVGVTEEDLTVSVSPAPASGLDVNERLAALHERLSRLEHDIAGVTERIERIEPDPELDTSGATDVDVDARWRSFLDLQKIVADRLDER